MCGIVGVVARREISVILLEGLRRLEYRGYDSAGLAMVGPVGAMQRIRRTACERPTMTPQCYQLCRVEADLSSGRGQREACRFVEK